MNTNRKNDIRTSGGYLIGQVRYSSVRYMHTAQQRARTFRRFEFELSTPQKLGNAIMREALSACGRGAEDGT